MAAKFPRASDVFLVRAMSSLPSATFGTLPHLSIGNLRDATSHCLTTTFSINEVACNADVDGAEEGKEA